MEESIYSYMKVGIIHFMAYPETMRGEGPILRTLEKIATDDYFTGVEISWIKDKTLRKKARDLLETSHLMVGYAAQPRLLTQELDLNSLDEEQRKRAIEDVKLGIDEAWEIGAKGVAIMSGKDPGQENRDQAYQLLVNSLKQICAYAQSRDELTISLEVFDREIDKKCLIGPAAEARRLAHDIAQEYENFGLIVDLSHLPLLNETPTQAIIPVGDYLIGAHLGNCILRDKAHPAYGDQHPGFGIKGGENDVEEVAAFLRVLLDIGFLNSINPPLVSFEVKPLEGESSEAVIANAKRVLREAWTKV